MAQTDIQKLTDAQPNQTAYLPFSTAVSSADGLSITFDFYAYGGTGADGISFFIVDGSQPIKSAGGFGGSLGYAPYIAGTTNQPGVAGGYLGIGLDEFGSYSNGSEGRNGGPGNRPDSVVVRGSVATNYDYLGGNPLPGGQSLDVPGAGATREQAKRSAKVDLSPTGVLSVKLDLNANGIFTDPGEELINISDLVQRNGALPSTLTFGFAASTGAQTNVHEVGNFSVKTFGGADIPGRFTPDLVFVDNGNNNNNQSGGAGNDTIITGDGSDRLTGQAGNDVIVGGGGADTLAGGAGGDRFYFRGANRGAALKQSTLRALDKITDFAFNANPAERDLFGLDFDNNLATIEKPRGLFNAGIERGGLLKAARSAYADKNQKKRGNQALKVNEAVFFRLGKRTFLSVNDNKAPFSSANDLLVDVTGIQFKPGDAKQGALKLADYFVV
jgi:serralysin